MEKTAYTDKGREGKKKTFVLKIRFFYLPFEHMKVFEELGFPVDLSNPIFPKLL
jgi:hypothetical protein